jgi:hypothetical protein
VARKIILAFAKVSSDGRKPAMMIELSAVEVGRRVGVVCP